MYARYVLAMYVGSPYLIASGMTISRIMRSKHLSRSDVTPQNGTFLSNVFSICDANAKCASSAPAPGPAQYVVSPG